jgi:hypothetical protein
MADIRYTVTIDASTGAAEIKKLEGEIDKLAGTTKKGGEEAAASQPKWVEFAKGMVAGFISVQALEAAGRKLIGFFTDSVKAAAESETAENNLKNTLAATGREVKQNAEHYAKYAQELMKATVYDDEQIKASQTLLLQLTKLDREGLDEATRGAIGLSRALDIDLRSATMMVAKAMEGNYETLGRYGIKVKENTSDEEKRAEILSKLNSMYARATGELNTYSGSVTNLKKNMGELKETLGGVLTNSETYRAVIKSLTGDINALNEALGKKKKNILDSAIYYAAASPYLGAFAQKAQWLRIEYEATNKILEKNKLATTATTAGTAAAAAAQIILTEAVSKYSITLKETPMLVGRVRDAYKWLTTELGETETKYRHMGMVAWQAVEQMSEGPQYVKKAWVENLEAIRRKYDEVLGYIQADTAAIFGAWSELSRNQMDAEIDRVTKSYEARKEAILNSTMDEEQKAAAIKNLEAGQEISTKKLQREAVGREKSIAIWEATINGAVAFTKALATLAPPWSFIQAAISLAAAGIQIAAISARPLPLQAGAFTMDEGLAYLHPGEIVAPQPMMRETFREIIREERVNQPQVLNVYLDGQKISGTILNVVEKGFRRRQLGRSIIQ